MVNFNGVLLDAEVQLNVNNRSFLYGDGVFETLKVVDHKILFFEDHYFRLMASMRIIRIDIPMTFTMEYLENQILSLVRAKGISECARVRLTVYRDAGGYYTPVVNTASFSIVASKCATSAYSMLPESFEVDLYKDFTLSKQLLSTLKTNNKLIQVTASIFASEYQLNSCLLLNEERNVVEATNGNLFMVVGERLITPPISEGCLNGIMRKQILRLAKTIEGLEVLEAPISPFELQKADELFITNVIVGIQPITKYRKKEFNITVAKQLTEKLNASIQAI